MADTEVKELVINTLTHKQFKAAQEAGTLSPYELYGTPDTSVRLPVLTPMWFDHIANDVSWLRADTFSWHSGDVYKAAYEHLSREWENANKESTSFWSSLSDDGQHFVTKSKAPSVGEMIYKCADSDDVPYGYVITEAVGKVTSENSDSSYNVTTSSGESLVLRPQGTEILIRACIDEVNGLFIHYRLAEDGHKICYPSQESKIMDLYEQTGVADYYLLDTTNKQFKLPRKHKRKLIQSYKNGTTWYNLYSDGWVEQGGVFTNTASSAKFNSISLPIAMGSTNYVVGTTCASTYTSANSSSHAYAMEKGAVVNNLTTSTFDVFTQDSTSGSKVLWQVSGYAAESEYASAGMNLEYYYVGNFEQDSVEQTAGLNTESFNGKADVGLNNITNGAKELMARESMPSGTYKDLTIGATETTYTAPADGYFVMIRKLESGKHLAIRNTVTGLGTTAHFYSNSGWIRGYVFAPAKAGDTVQITYSDTPEALRFVYAEGAKHLA